jgi:hypothetical protein
MTGDGSISETSNYHNSDKELSCYFCHSGPPLHEHHIIPQRFGGPDKPENIVELCHLCHKRIERLYDKSFYEWFGITDESGQRRFHRPCETESCSNQAKLKVKSVRDVYGHHDVPIDIHRASKPGLRCRPCVAESCREMFDMWKRRRNESINKLHEIARNTYSRGIHDWDKRPRAPADHEIKRCLVPEPPQSPQQLMSDIIVNEANS